MVNRFKLIRNEPVSDNHIHLENLNYLVKVFVGGATCRSAENDMDFFAYSCLLGSAFTIAFSLPLGRLLLAVSLVLIAAHLIRERRLPVIPLVAWIGFLFVVVAVVVTVFGVRPSIGVPKLRKLLWFIAIPVSATLISSPHRLSRLLGAYAVGTGVLSVWTCVMNPIQAMGAVRSGEAVNFMSALISAGSMTDGQRLMLGIIIAIGFLFICRKEKRSSLAWWILLALQCAALVLTFKRGSWICTCIIVSVFVAVKMNWKYLLVLAFIVLTILALPPVRSRLGGLREEFRIDGGGRLTMWFKIAPALIEKYPRGIGWRSLTNEMMREVAPEVEPNRNHLHSNIAQVLVATGWLGLFVYVAWMIRAVVDAVQFTYRATGRSVAEEMNALVLLLMLIGLLLNGIVEYNFADAELLIVYAFIMGCVAAGLRRQYPEGIVPPAARAFATP